jgi:predicted transcriptional regulator
MKKVIETSYPYQYKQISDNLTRSPLIKKSEKESYRFKYDFLEKYFVCLYLIQVFGGKQLEHYPYDTLSRLPKEIINDFVRYFSNYDRRVLFMENAKSILQELIKKSKSSKNNHKYQMAISNLIFLTIKIHSESMSAEKNMEIIKELYGLSEDTKKLEHIYIFSKMFPLDFRNLEIWDSKFIEFENLFKSKFKDTEFYYCYFENHKKFYRKHEQIWENIKFDTTCDLGDIKLIISREITSIEVQNRITRILKSINTHVYKYSDNDQTILECLVKVSYLKYENSNYRLTGKGRNYLKGKVARKTREAIECILSKQNNKFVR